MTSNTIQGESRQARRWRERQQTKNPAASPRQPYILLCRSADDHGHGAWVLMEVDTPEDGDICARGLEAVVGETPHCELVANTDEGLRSWAAANITQRDAARRLGEVLR